MQCQLTVTFQVALQDILVLCLAVAIFYRGAIDPALVIRKSTLYGALGVIFIVLFAGIENLIEETVEQRLGLPGMAGSLIAAGGVALALIPLHNKFRKLLDRYVLKGELTAEGEPHQS